MDGSPPGSSVHGVLQARILEWVSIPFSSRSSQTTDRTQVSRTGGEFFTDWAPRETQKINFRVIAGLWVLIVKKGKWKSLSRLHLFTTSRSVLWWVTQKFHSEFGSFQLITGGKRGLAVWRTSSCGPVIIHCPRLSTYFSTFANETFNLMCIHTLYHYVKYQLYFILNTVSKRFLALYDNLSACQCRREKRCGLNPWVGNIPGRRKWLLTPVW